MYLKRARVTYVIWPIVFNLLILVLIDRFLWLAVNDMIIEPQVWWDICMIYFKNALVLRSCSNQTFISDKSSVLPKNWGIPFHFGIHHFPKYCKGRILSESLYSENWVYYAITPKTGREQGTSMMQETEHFGYHHQSNLYLYPI